MQAPPFARYSVIAARDQFIIMQLQQIFKHILIKNREYRPFDRHTASFISIPSMRLWRALLKGKEREDWWKDYVLLGRMDLSYCEEVVL